MENAARQIDNSQARIPRRRDAHDPGRVASAAEAVV